MHKVAIGAVALFGLLFAPIATACWSCGSSTLCCTEASQGTMGSSTCLDNTVCFSTCICYYCTLGGLSCAGSGPDDCENQHGACEEHQTLKVVPNGESLDLQWMSAPPVLDPAGRSAAGEFGTCGAV